MKVLPISRPHALSVYEQAVAKFERFFTPDSRPFVLSVPGRVNLIGEHIDYHDLPVLPIAIQKQIAIAFLPRTDGRIRAISDKEPDIVDISLSSDLPAGPSGYWGNYVHAAATALQTRQSLRHGIDAYVASDLPSAAGLSSSSALLIAFSLALLRANEIKMTLDELTAVLPDGEQLVGTRGGAMDHVAILGSRAGFATLINSFFPLDIEYVPVPANWRFVIAHSLVHAEKSGALRSEYNARRAAGNRALEKLGLASYREALIDFDEQRTAALVDDTERNAFLHVTTEARRVENASLALRAGDLSGFGRLLCESHASLRERLRVSLPDIDALVECAVQAGAFGARVTGGGFGGCVVCLCTRENVDEVCAGLVENYYGQRSSFNPEQHLFIAEPSQGALTSTNA